MMQAEIEKVKKRREERAIEKAQHEEEMVGYEFWFSKYNTHFHVCVDSFSWKEKLTKDCFVEAAHSCLL